MIKYSELKHSSKYGSVHSIIENVSSDSSLILEPKKKCSLNWLRAATTTKDVNWDDNAHMSGGKKPKRKQSKKEPLLTSRLKRAVEKIQNIAQEKQDERLPDDSDEMIHIRLPVTYTDDEPKIPKEIFKTVTAFFIMMFSLTVNLMALALVHEYVPESDKYDPLPDIIISNVPAQDWGLDVSEYMIMATLSTTVCVLVFHKYRFVVFRRFFLIMAILYLMRSVTMSVTILPVSSKTYACSPKLNNTNFLVIVKRVVDLMSGFGLSVNGKHVYCGDYIYSGHTVVLVMCWLLISEYTPKAFFVVHCLYGFIALLGVVMVLIAHGHYTLDVLIGYFITTRVFWMYHTMANNANLKKRHQYNYLSRTWCFRIFLYFEENVLMPLPCQYDWPRGFRR